MESIHDLKPKLEDIASLLNLAVLGQKNNMTIKPLLKQIKENLDNTIIQLDNIL